MPNWKKVITSGSDAILNNLTVSGTSSFLNDSVTIEGNSSTILEVDGDISASGDLYVEGLTYDNGPVTDGVVVYDTTTGQFYYTGSYSSGSTGGGGDSYKHIGIGDSTNGASTGGEIVASGPNAYLTIVTGSNISASVNTGYNDLSPIQPDSITLQAIPSPSDTFIQYNSASVFHGTESLRFEAEGDTDSPSSSSFRTGKKDPSISSNDLGNYGGSHLLNDNTDLATNARFPNINNHYHLLGFAGRSQPKPKPGGGSYNTAGTYLGMDLPAAGNNQVIPGSLSPQHIQQKDLYNNVISGDLMVGGPYIHFDQTKGFNIYASNFITSPYSPATTLGSDGLVIYPSASSEYDASGSFLTPLASASGRIVIDETALPQNSTLDIIGRKTTQFKTGDSGSELNYLIYESSTGTIGIGKGLSIQNVKDEAAGTSINAFISGGIKITGSSIQDDISLLTTGGLQVHPSVINATDGDYNRFFPFGQIGTKQGSFRSYPDNSISLTPSLYLDFERPRREDGTTSRTLVIEDSDIEISRAKAGTSDGVKGGILFTSNPNIYFFNETDASASLSGSLLEGSASAQIKFDTGSSAIEFFAGDTTTDLINVLHISQSNNNPTLGIGTQTPLTSLDIRSITASDPANIILRTNEDGVIQVGEETGRIIFAIESASFLGTNFIASGSTSAIYSEVIGSNINGAYGSLIFEVNDSSNVTAPIKALTMGYGLGASSNDVGFIFSGSIKSTAAANSLSLLSSTNNNTLAYLGFSGVSDLPELDRGMLLLNDDGTTHVRLNGAAGSTDFLNTGNNVAIGTTTAPEKLTIEGNISASGNIITTNITSSNIQILGTASIAYFETLYETSSIIYSSGSTKFGDTMDDFHDFTGSVDITGSIVASNLSGTNTGDQDLSSYSTTAQLNASSSALQTNISTNTGNISTNTTNITSLTDTVSTISTVIGSDSATNVDTFATSTYNGAIYDYILKDSTVGARAGQFMVAHDDGDVTFTDVSTKHLSDSTIPEITADISGGSTVRVRVTNGNGYTFKAFTKKL